MHVMRKLLASDPWPNNLLVLELVRPTLAGRYSKIRYVSPFPVTRGKPTSILCSDGTRA